jgi:DNA-binding transcriptional MerR regulator
MYPIGQFSKVTGVTVKALYHYERRGLLKPRRTRADVQRIHRSAIVNRARILEVVAEGSRRHTVILATAPGSS